MDKNKEQVMQAMVETTIKNLEKNHMKGHYFHSQEQMLEYLKTVLVDGLVVSVGGSMTLFETGIIDLLKDSPIKYLDRYQKDLSPKLVQELFRQVFFADIYLTSTNAITMQGELVNVDGNSNRVAAMLFGPQKVYVICSTQKIVKDEQAAYERVKSIACVANNIRLNTNNPCTTIKSCVNCNSENRICCNYVTMKQQRIKDRIEVLFIDDAVGY